MVEIPEALDNWLGSLLGWMIICFTLAIGFFLIPIIWIEQREGKVKVW
ncbi:MAG: hypothetical protein PHY56_07845 [Candidatus Omnitrophica bacterium]|nr:hypothetical protein [Candidatus Omnitrophota bacterium]